MDRETRQALSQLNNRIDSVNESLSITTEALGKFMEECNGKFSTIDEVLQILVDETRFSRNQITREIAKINRRLDELSE